MDMNKLANKLKYAEYLIKYNDKINSLRKYCEGVNSKGAHRKLITIPAGVVPFSYFYTDLSGGYVTGSICSVDELPAEFIKLNMKNNLFNSKSKNVSAMKRGLAKQTKWMENFCKTFNTDFHGTSFYNVHEFKPCYVGIPHSYAIWNYKGSITNEVVCMLINLQKPDKVENWWFTIKKDDTTEKWKNTDTKKLIYTEEDLLKKNEFLLQ